MTEYKEQVAEVKDGVLSQPDAYTCQSACVCMALGLTDIAGMRARLCSLGEAGDPYVMGEVLRAQLGDRYEFNDNASLSEIREWLKAGEFLISHGWFTGSGHVIALDGVAIDPTTLSYKISVKDPWGEFSFGSWAYLPGADHFDGYYSPWGLYAAIVVGHGPGHAAEIYRRGELDSSRKGAWVHRIKPQ
jgi:hypothetical protein